MSLYVPELCSSDAVPFFTKLVTAETGGYALSSRTGFAGGVLFPRTDMISPLTVGRLSKPNLLQIQTVTTAKVAGRSTVSSELGPAFSLPAVHSHHCFITDTPRPQGSSAFSISKA